ncbi:hypothetical protein J6590_040870 [Homalodisca vitripennis]|nr:hypothetical protein J6590_040870 [Homalodisca vitripennis]
MIHESDRNEHRDSTSGNFETKLMSVAASRNGRRSQKAVHAFRAEGSSQQLAGRNLVRLATCS